MTKFIKILSALMCILLLCSCTISTNNNTNSNKSTTSSTTNSTTNTTTSTTVSTTTPTAKAVSNYDDLSTAKVVWGYGSVTNHQQPDEPKSLNNTFSKLGGKWLIGNKKTICLTFDEGYENGYTPSILDTLKAKNIKAIFFVTYDFAKDNPDLIKRMIKEGHTVGNHSYHHYSMDELDVDTAKEEIEYLHNYIKTNYNYTMSYFRFPKGEFSQQSLAIAKDLGYKSVFWSYAYADWNVDNQPNTADALDNICDSTHNGEILLLHAVSKTNASILGNVIDDIKQQGYTFTVNI